MSTALPPPRPVLPPCLSPKGSRHSTPDLPSPPPAAPDSPKPREAPDQPSPRPLPTDRSADEPVDDDIVDMETFNQILELDEDDGQREFSAGMIDAYFDQATQTFKDMDSALKIKDLGTLSALGHYLKGSSAALGVVKVKESCEKIQHYGLCRDEDLDKDISSKDALGKIGDTLSQVKEEYTVAEKWLKNWLSENAA